MTDILINLLLIPAFGLGFLCWAVRTLRKES